MVTIMIGTLQKAYSSARSIAEGIKVNKTFTKLTLNFDDISDAGATFIAVAIKVNKTLTNLHLSTMILVMPVLYLLLRQSKSTRL